MTKSDSQPCGSPLWWTPLLQISAFIWNPFEYIYRLLITSFVHEASAIMANDSSYYNCSQPPDHLTPDPDISGVGVSSRKTNRSHQSRLITSRF